MPLPSSDSRTLKSLFNAYECNKDNHINVQMLCSGGKEMVKILIGPSGRETAEMWVWPSSCHSVRWAGTRWRAQHHSLPLNPLPAQMLLARRGPFCVSGRSGHVSVWLVTRSDWKWCEIVYGCINGLDMLHAGKRITPQKQKSLAYKNLCCKRKKNWRYYTIFRSRRRYFTVSVRFCFV